MTQVSSKKKFSDIDSYIKNLIYAQFHKSPNLRINMFSISFNFLFFLIYNIDLVWDDQIVLVAFWVLRAGKKPFLRGIPIGAL